MLKKVKRKCKYLLNYVICLKPTQNRVKNKKVEVKVISYELLRIVLPQGEFCRPYCSLSVSSNERFEISQPSGGYDV